MRAAEAEEPAAVPDAELPPTEVDPSLTLIGEPNSLAATSAEHDAAFEGEDANDPMSAATSQDSRLIVSVPGVQRTPSTLEPSAQPQPPAHPSSEIDDKTVSRAQIDLLAAASGDTPLGPVVKAIPCPDGHPNPPHSATCRICGADLGPSTPVTVPRPVLGTLRLSTGDSVPLDRGAVIGRSPEAITGERGDRRNVVRVPSPNKDISRNHLEVKLDGWHVLLTDLRSTNGTLVTVPGEQPQRLRPDEPFPIPPGTVVNLGDEVTFTYVVDA